MTDYRAAVLDALRHFDAIYHRPAAWGELQPRCHIRPDTLRRTLAGLVADNLLTYTRRDGWQPVHSDPQE